MVVVVYADVLVVGGLVDVVVAGELVEGLAGDDEVADVEDVEGVVTDDVLDELKIAVDVEEAKPKSRNTNEHLE